MNTAANVALIVLALGLGGCASPPERINDLCAVFDHGEGWFTSWRAAAERSETRHGVPVPVLMATLRKESGFKGNARPPRTKLMGFIPWTRPSSAYGYSQALDGTWDQYQSETGKFAAQRDDFADAVNFVGWYHAKTANRFGVSRGDTFNLYLAYYLGWTAYGRGDWRANASLQQYARDTAAMAKSYAVQMKNCG